MVEQIQFWGLIALVIVLGLLLASWTRAILIYLFTGLVSPGLTAVAKPVLLWIAYLLKTIWLDHWVIIQNLLKPHSAIFPSLSARRKHPVEKS